MPTNLENSAGLSLATESEKVSFHSIPKEMQCQRMFQLPHNCAYFTCQQGNAQNPSSQASAVGEPRNSRCSRWVQKRQKNQRSNCQYLLITEKAKEFQKNIYFCFIDYIEVFNCVDHNKLWEISERDGNTRPPNLPLEKPICRSGSNSQYWTWNYKVNRVKTEKYLF